VSYPVFSVPAGDVLPIFFSTYGGTNGESVTATGLAVTDIEIYKDGSTTQRASDAGYTLLDTDGLDFDSLTGIHGFSIDTGDNTDASFYTVGAWFTVVVSAITVSSQTVSFIAAQFRIMPAEGVAGKPKVDTDTFGGSAGTFASGRPEVNVSHWLGTAAATPTTAGVPEVDLTHWNGTAVASPDTAGYPKVTIKSGTGTGELSLSSGGVSVRGNIKKAAAFAKFMFLMTDSTNHNPATGKTVTATISRDGGAFASLNSGDSVTDVGNGIYEVDLDATDTNCNNFILRFTATASDDTFVHGFTQV
jgi:hypothetical protein